MHDDNEVEHLQRKVEELETKLNAKAQKKRPKDGHRVLSKMERELVIRFAERSLTNGGLDETVHKIHRKPTDYGTLQRLIHKGFAEKRGRRNYHGLTAKGIEYYKEHCEVETPLN